MISNIMSNPAVTITQPIMKHIELMPNSPPMLDMNKGPKPIHAGIIAWCNLTVSMNPLAKRSDNYAVDHLQHFSNRPDFGAQLVRHG
jgi:hypothetical protein